MTVIVGVDEAGRGPLAGPVTVAAVILKNKIDGLNDSKKLSEAKRRQLEPKIIQNALDYCVVHIDVDVIDDINILQASLHGMQKAVSGLVAVFDKILVDGNKCPEFSMPAEPIIGGDGLIAEISAASILAKNARDRLMLKIHEEFPEYRFDKHKGYGTKLHNEMLLKHGPCRHHRRSFSPVQRLLQTEMF